MPQIRANYLNGKEFERQGYQAAIAHYGQNNVVQNVSFRAYQPNGELADGRAVADLIVRDEFSKQLTLVEFKLHDLVPLTARQQVRYPLAEQNGVQIRGDKATGFGLSSGTPAPNIGYMRVNSTDPAPWFR